MKKDFIIVGQGIAGSVLAFLLKSKGYSVVVIDDGFKGSSSMVAAGMWNPVTFRKISAGWMASELLVAADRFYPAMEKETGVSFYHPLRLARIFTDTGTANLWDERSVNPELSNYLTDDQNKVIKEYFVQPFGHGIIKGSGWMNVPLMLNTLRSWLKHSSSLREELFDYHLLELSDELVRYKEITSEHIVFCTGVRNSENPLFEKLPVIPNKGEVLTLRMKDLPLSLMVNFGNFIVPLGDDLFRLGATYKLDAPDDQPTGEALDELLDGLRTVYKGSIEVVDHQAGYRPTSRTRMPLIGAHPAHKRTFCFNGLGSKGVMLAPWTAHHLVDHITSSAKIIRDVDLARYAM